MKICHVLATVDDLSAGPSYSVPGLAEGQSDLGYDVSIHTVEGWRSERPVGLPDTGNMNSPTVVRHRWTWPRMPVLNELAWSEGLRTDLMCQARSVGIIHSHGLWLMPNVFPSWAIRQKRARAKLVLSPRGMLGDAALRFSSAKKRFFWSLLQSSALQVVHCFHATSEAEVREIRDAGMRQPIAVIPNGIFVPPRVAAGRDPLMPRTVLSLGRIHPKKGLDRLLRAWSSVEATHPSWRLRIVGPDEDGTALHLAALGTSLGIRRASIEGPVFGHEKQNLLSGSDLFVLPTLNENFAMTVAEALAAGVPVISSKGAPWSGLVENRCGWWIDHGVEELAKTLNEAMSLSTEQRSEMGERGRRWMEAAFSWRSASASMAEVYEWLCSRRDLPKHLIIES